MKEQLEKEIAAIAQAIIDTKEDWNLSFLHSQIKKLDEKITILHFVEKYYQANGSSENHINFRVSTVANFIDENLHKEIEEGVEEVTNIEKAETSDNIDVALSEKHDEIDLAQEEIDPLSIAEKFLEKENDSPTETEESLNDILSQVDEHPGFDAKEQKPEQKSKSLNDRFVKDTPIGLNDRLAFVKHLFLGSESEYNRTLNKLNEKQSPQDLVIFLEQEVKPIYNYWKGKEEYEDRFMALLLKKFDS